jgi:hypothetical protein
MRLEKPSYLPADSGALIDGYTSLIWTERYLEPGDFQLKTHQVSKTLNLLPEMTFVTHRETREVMMVEDHQIIIGPDGPELTVTGRTLDAFLDNRHIEGPYNKKYKMLQTYTCAQAAAVIIWNAIVNDTNEDLTREGTQFQTIKGAIDNIAISDSTITEPGDRQRRWLKQGPLYPTVLKFLNKDDLGIRIMRPQTTDAKILTVDKVGADRGLLIKTDTTTVNKLRFDIYEGRDKTDGPLDTRVVFSYDSGHIDNPDYLFSIKDMKTSIEIMSEFGGADVFQNEAAAALTGWNRRVMTFDGGTLDIPAEPERPEHPDEPRSNATQATIDAYRDAMDTYRDNLDLWREDHNDWRDNRANLINEFLADNQEEAKREIKKHKRVHQFNGVISPLAPYKYNKNYRLGDKVTLQADYGYKQTMIVIEHTRTEDKEGDRGFPGLALP